jgi:hypothetical protein
MKFQTFSSVIVDFRLRALGICALLVLMIAPNLAAAQQLPFGFWSSATSYSTGDIIARAGSSGTDLYKAVASGTNHDPSTDNGSYWKFYEIYENQTLRVGPGERFPDFLSAWGFVDDASIPDGTVTIQLDDGTYSLGTGILIDNPWANHIKIVGNTTTPANVTLSITADPGGLPQNGFFIQSGCALGDLDGVTVSGPGAANVNANSTAITSAGRLFLGNVVVTGMPFGFYAYSGASMSMLYCTATYCTVGFKTQGGVMEFRVSAYPCAGADHCGSSFQSYGGQIYSVYSVGVASTNSTTWDWLVSAIGRIYFPSSTTTGTAKAAVGTNSILIH